MTEYLIVAMNVASAFWMLYLFTIVVVLIFNETARFQAQVFGFRWWVPVGTIFVLIWLITYNIVG
jgi:hypothetical protein